MAGAKGRSGRKKQPGKLYHLWYRPRPDEDPPELFELLELIAGSRGAKRRDILRRALLGGLEEARQAAEASSEDSEMAGLLDDMLTHF